jgi:uncharacterized membrane protein
MNDIGIEKNRLRDNFAITPQLMYLVAIAELAIYSFAKADIAMTRPRPLPESLQGLNPAMAYISGTLFLTAVLVFLLKRYRAAGLLTIANLIFWLITSRHILNLWRDHINGFKTLWFISGALLILTMLSNYRKYQKKVIWLNLIILFVFFVDCGIAHFQYAEFVKNLIPEFIPFPLFFTYFTGTTLILGGVGLLIPQTQKLAALLAGIQVFGWFVLLHLPRALTLHGDEWIGVGESLAVSGICFMIYKLLAK